MSAVPSVCQMLTLFSALSLFAVVTSCHCPEYSCMRIANMQSRCECCVFVFLGKRSGVPPSSAVSKGDHDVDSDHATNKRTSLYFSPFFSSLIELTNSAHNKAYNGYRSQNRDDKMAVYPRSLGLGLSDSTVNADEIPTNRMWYNVLLNSEEIFNSEVKNL